MLDQKALFETLLRLGDNTLILGHRVGEWCGKGPALEEDIALANTALDLIGQTQLWLGLAAEVEGEGRSADDLAMLRDVWDFRNLLLVELPNWDFGHTIMRQFLFDQFHLLQLQKMVDSSDERIAGIASKTVKEVTYHLERSSQTVIALGDGTQESNQRMQAALNTLWPFVGEMFVADAIDAEIVEAGIVPDASKLRPDFDTKIAKVIGDAMLTLPDSEYTQSGGKTGSRHTEHLGHILTQMQWMQRAYPGATW